MSSGRKRPKASGGDGNVGVRKAVAGGAVRLRGESYLVTGGVCVCVVCHMLCSNVDAVKKIAVSENCLKLRFFLFFCLP